MHLRAATLSAATLIGLLATAMAGSAERLPAQDAGDPLRGLRRAIAATRPGTRVRLELRDGQRVTGTLGPLRTDAVEVGDSSGALVGLRDVDVTRFWRRGRATGTGALVAGIPASAFGALLGLLGHGLCEYDCHGSAAGTAMGVGLVVGALGAGAGAIVGAAFPQWHLAWERGQHPSAPSQQPPAPPVVTTRRDSVAITPRGHTRHLGEVTALLTGGFAGYGASSGYRSHADASVGASVGLGFRRGRLGFGPETSLHFGAVGSAWSISAVARMDLGHRGSAARTPYIVAGVGATNHGDEGSGLFLGFGATVKDRWRVEGRWQTGLGYPDAGTAPTTVITLGIGRLLDW